MFLIGVCEDDDAIRQILGRGLSHAGYDTLMAHDGREAMARFGGRTDLSAIVMDIGLPDSDGRDVVQALKAGGQQAPVLFLTAFDGAHHKLQGFAVGADDYVVKPFDLREVVARLEVLTRRARSPQGQTEGLTLDPLAHSACSSVGEVRLTPTEFRMLAALMARRGDVVRRGQLVAAAWPDGAIVSENTLDSFVRRIRTKLDEIGLSSVVETVRGIGYRVE